MAEWWSIEVFSGDKLPASGWRYAYEDDLTEAAITHGAMYYEWHDTEYGVIFEVLFRDDEQWEAFRALPAVRAALDGVPDPVNGLHHLPRPGRRVRRAASPASPSPRPARPRSSSRSRKKERKVKVPAQAPVQPQGRDRRAAPRTRRRADADRRAGPGRGHRRARCRDTRG